MGEKKVNSLLIHGACCMVHRGISLNVVGIFVVERIKRLLFFQDSECLEFGPVRDTTVSSPIDQATKDMSLWPYMDVAMPWMSPCHGCRHAMDT